MYKCTDNLKYSDVTKTVAAMIIPVKERGFELYYDDGSGSRLQPLPQAISKFLMGSGFDRLLDHLSQIDISGLGRAEHPPASKAAVESMLVIQISDEQIINKLHCDVCKEAFVYKEKLVRCRVITSTIPIAFSYG
ncbi:hypothetical protein R6Q59_035787 [Mikania micrantha]